MLQIQQIRTSNIIYVVSLCCESDLHLSSVLFSTNFLRTTCVSSAARCSVMFASLMLTFICFILSGRLTKTVRWKTLKCCVEPRGTAESGDIYLYNVDKHLINRDILIAAASGAVGSILVLQPRFCSCQTFLSGIHGFIY